MTKKSGQSKATKKPAKPAKPTPKKAEAKVTVKASAKPAAVSPRKPAVKPTAAKPTAKPAAKAAAKPTLKPTTKPAPKAAAVKTAAKPTSKPAPAKPDSAKPAPKAGPSKPVAGLPGKPGNKAPSAPTPNSPTTGTGTPASAGAKPGSGAATPAPGEHAGGNRKGITVVSAKPQGPKKPAPKKNISADIAALAGQLLSGGSVRRPLISSGPNAPSLRPLGLQSATEEAPAKVVGKTPFGKKDLERYRLMLVRKRAELLGDITTLEQEALRGESGSLSNLPQHMAEQGSEAYEQSLQLDLAAQDRKLLKEIDDAISRIDAGTYGVCEVTGKPIKAERLDELPWARFTIEAQRELERRSMRT